MNVVSQKKIGVGGFLAVVICMLLLISNLTAEMANKTEKNKGEIATPTPPPSYITGKKDIPEFKGWL